MYICAPASPTDLVITDEGLLMDQKTGEVINQFGATRFDVAVRGEAPALTAPLAPRRRPSAARLCNWL